MQYNPSILLGALLLASANLGAQTINTCSLNLDLIRFVDAQGNPAPTVPVTLSGLAGTNTVNAASYALEEVYLSFANLPVNPSPTSDGSWLLYVHVTDFLGDGDAEVRSANEPMDRFVRVRKIDGIVDIELPYNPNPSPTSVTTLADRNEILLISPLRRATTGYPCVFKAHFGDTFFTSSAMQNPNNPFIVLPQDQYDNCALYSFGYFRIGDSTPGSDIAGSVFNDIDRDGTRDAGEPPLAGWTVQLVTGATSQSTVTNSNGNYVFPNVAAGPYTVELVPPAGYQATTSRQQAIEVCGCANQALNEFGAATTAHGCEGHTIGFWRNRHGSQLVQQHNILASLPALCLADANGTMATPPQTISEWQSWLQGANAVNMAYMLSAQLAATHCSVLARNVDPACRIVDPVLGNIMIHDLIQQAITSLCNDGYTPVDDPNRPAQTALKNALDAANNNSNWQ